MNSAYILFQTDIAHSKYAKAQHTESDITAKTDIAHNKYAKAQHTESDITGDDKQRNITVRGRQRNRESELLYQKRWTTSSPKKAIHQ
ncbi:pentapeptide repeat-containing protein [Sesbania bispinosa]|nr:pentapeptide repeat-containing protein [Sesbania bispinosa]